MAGACKGGPAKAPAGQCDFSSLSEAFLSALLSGCWLRLYCYFLWWFPNICSVLTKALFRHIIKLHAFWSGLKLQTAECLNISRYTDFSAFSLGHASHAAVISAVMQSYDHLSPLSILELVLKRLGFKEFSHPMILSVSMRHISSHHKIVWFYNFLASWLTKHTVFHTSVTSALTSLLDFQGQCWLSLCQSIMKWRINVEYVCEKLLVLAGLCFWKLAFQFLLQKWLWLASNWKVCLSIWGYHSNRCNAPATTEGDPP